MRKIKMNEHYQIEAGDYTIILDSRQLERLQQMTESDFMQESLDGLTNFIVKVYDRQCDGNVRYTAEECMELLALISYIKGDYNELCNIRMESRVFDEEKKEK